ncbi:MAG: glycosyltransferase [Bacteroidia bacterium]|nr:glycosyltransferase [Bacteroidia bacterium]
MTTIIFTYRNKEIKSVKNCLDSLKMQSYRAFEVTLVNYGSNKNFTESINDLAKKYDFVTILNCNTQGELWCKSRAINIALKQCHSTYVFVGDVDMLFHPEFVEKLNTFKKEQKTTYFQVGFLSQIESKQIKSFENYKIKFKSNEEATGMTFFNTKDLFEINGFDEYYHGWGSEDTDVHIRLKNAGKTVKYFDDQILMLHQWHPKLYRTRNSLEPFHSHLEQINHAYLDLTKQSKKIKANLNFGFGNYNESDYDALNNPELILKCTNRRDQIKGLIHNILMNFGNKVVKLSICPDPEFKSVSQIIKKVLFKKTIPFLTMQQTNDLLLETLVSQLRNCPYKYKFDKKGRSIDLTLNLSGL